MGRLSTNITILKTMNDSNLTGDTKLDIHSFVDEHGNVTQINKISKDRLKYYIDPIFDEQTIDECVIGVNNEFEGPCTDGVGLGFGDNTFAYAKYT